ncbi:LamB/YcsF family protein [Salicibibacter halophilus]|uniref:5-oxoprolinase subunit A n=1 Tax=Salicibibacter halophilus TaxID=2502791 RepID=A0A514LGY8_9BACI|nr:5-oxoprolinase subunit PxpA [Salicibibacter halophilus]QDI91113.1 LamB/YcsF family protein [Salicibibacter halophilus]
MTTIDMNCDMGESFGVYKMGADEEILPYISSANIACGFHAGDPSTMRKTVRLAIENGAAIGAHPGLPDLMGFGRRHIDLLPEEAYDIVAYQVGALWGIVQSEGGRMRHVKAHGMLYNRATKEPELSEAIARAVYDIDPELILFGLAGGELLKAGKNMGLKTGSEVFADRTYQEDGTLTSRREANALIEDADQAANQVIRMIGEQKVRSQQGKDVDIHAETVCIHGDGAYALDFAKNVREKVENAGVQIQAIGG